jgi:hypothetical protein
MIKPERFQQWRLYYSEDNINNRLWHIRGTVDDQIIIRIWSKHKQGWWYGSVDDWWFQDLIDDGKLTLSKRKDTE